MEDQSISAAWVILLLSWKQLEFICFLQQNYNRDLKKKQTDIQDMSRLKGKTWELLALQRLDSVAHKRLWLGDSWWLCPRDKVQYKPIHCSGTPQARQTYPKFHWLFTTKLVYGCWAQPASYPVSCCCRCCHLDPLHPIFLSKIL